MLENKKWFKVIYFSEMFWELLFLCHVIGKQKKDKSHKILEDKTEKRLGCRTDKEVRRT